eukprot:gene19749-biopygen33098
MQRAVAKALYGNHHKKRCVELVLTLLGRGHRLDPAQAAALRRVTTLQRMLLRRRELRTVLERAWGKRCGGGAPPPPPAGGVGPVACLLATLKKLGWSWPRPTELRTARGETLDLLEVTEGRLAHEVRDAARRAAWKEAESRRAKAHDDVSGIGDGVDRDATCALLRRCPELTPYQLGIVRTIICGGTWTRARLHAIKVIPDPGCCYCGGAAEENQRHRWWDCPAWAKERARHPIAVAAYQEDWPACLVNCGVMPETLEGAAAAAAGAAGPHPAPEGAAGAAAGDSDFDDEADAAADAAAAAAAEAGAAGIPPAPAGEAA